MCVFPIISPFLFYIVVKYLIYLLSIIFLCGLNVGLAPYLRIYGQVPNFLFLIAVIWSVDKTDDDFWFFALFAGLFMDFSAGAWVGTFAIPLLLVCLAIRLLVQNYLVLELSLKYLAIVLFPAQLLFYFGSVGYAFVFYKLGLAAYPPSASGWLGSWVAGFLYNAALLYPMYIAAGYLKTFLGKYVVREYKVR